ncbi:hypothetical protein ATY27_16955 [Rheinheimera sp. F8]|nr:hypothetical protein ATY27_16955 [Rheinheimera sp. F8]
MVNTTAIAAVFTRRIIQNLFLFTEIQYVCSKISRMLLKHKTTSLQIDMESQHFTAHDRAIYSVLSLYCGSDMYCALTLARTLYGLPRDYQQIFAYGYRCELIFGLC